MNAVPKVSGNHDFNCQGQETDGTRPSGCYFCDKDTDCKDGTWLNTCAAGLPCRTARSHCKRAAAGNATAANISNAGKILFMGDSDVAEWDTSSAHPGSDNVGASGFTCKNVVRKLDGYMQSFNFIKQRTGSSCAGR